MPRLNCSSFICSNGVSRRSAALSPPICSGEDLFEALRSAPEAVQVVVAVIRRDLAPLRLFSLVLDKLVSRQRSG